MLKLVLAAYAEDQVGEEILMEVLLLLLVPLAVVIILGAVVNRRRRGEISEGAARAITEAKAGEYGGGSSGPPLSL